MTRGLGAPLPGRVRLQKGASLQIEGLRAEDQGWYECRVLFLDQHSPEDDSANGSWVHLTVNCRKQVVEEGGGQHAGDLWGASSASPPLAALVAGSLAASYPSRPMPALPVLRSGWRLPAGLRWNFLSPRLLPPWPHWAMGRGLLGPEQNTAHLRTQHVVFSKHLYA